MPTSTPHKASIFALTISLARLILAEVLPADNVPQGFPGSQSGIGSWFQANIGRDSTNGHSWCGYPYADGDPLFAPSLTVMGTATYDTDPEAWEKATREWCGLEARVTNPKTGKSLTMYIGDGFDPKWVKTPGSIDLMIGSYTSLAGHNPGTNKNDVIGEVEWELTGNLNTDWQAPGAKRPSGGGSTRRKKVQQSPTQAPEEADGSISSNRGLDCTWGCWGWDCGAGVPCQSPWQCRGGYCKP